MVLQNDNDLASIFQEREPTRAPSDPTAPKRARVPTPTEVDRIYRGINVEATERAEIARERSQRGVKKESFTSKLFKPLAWTMRNYNEQVAIPTAELITSAVRALVPGSDKRERENADALKEAWRTGDGFFGKLNNWWNTLQHERETRKNLFPLEKLVGGMLFDPLNLVGWGLMSKIPKALLIGQVLGPAERAYIRASQGVADGIIRGTIHGGQVEMLGFKLPRTPGLATLPGTRSLFKTTARTVAGKQATSFVAAVSSVKPELWHANPVGGFNKLRELLSAPKSGWDEATATVARMIDDVKDWTDGKHRMTFGREGEAAGFVNTEVKNAPAYLWSNFEAGTSSQTLRTALGGFLELQQQMVLSSKSAEIIAERALHRGLAHRMMAGIADDTAYHFQHGLIGKLNRGFAELVLGFQAYAPFNRGEETWRAFEGGVSGISMIDEEMFNLRLGSTMVSVPWSVREGSAAITSQLLGKTGQVEKVIGTHEWVMKLWKMSGGWGIDKNRDWGVGVRRNYLAQRADDLTADGVLPFLESGGEETRAIRDLIVTGAGGIEGLPKATTTHMQQLLVSYLGSNPATIRQLGTEIARRQLTKSKINKLATQYLGDVSPVNQRAFIDAIGTGARSIERVNLAHAKLVEDELIYLATTEPTEVANMLGWLLSEVSAMRVDNVDDMSRLIGMAAYFTKQSRDVPLIITRAMIEHSHLPNPAAMSKLWPKVHAALNEIVEREAALDAKGVIAAKIRQGIGGVVDDDMKLVADAFERMADANTVARTKMMGIVEEFFAEGSKGLRPELVVEAGSEDAAWRAFTARKSDVYRTLEKASVDDYSVIIQAATRLGASTGFSSDAVAAMTEEGARWAAHLKEAAGTLEFKDVFGERLLKMEAMRAAVIQELETGVLNPAQQAKVEAVFNGVATALERLPADQQLALHSLRERAIQNAVNDYNRVFVNYDDTMAFDDIMTGVAPFWRYESRAFPTLARFMIQKPFYGRTFGPGGYFWQATDEGYIPEEVAGLQASPIRGLVLGRLRRAYKDDYPSEYVGWLGRVEAWKNKLERYGFYAGTWQTWMFESMGKISEGRGLMADLGEDLPASLQTMLSAAVYGSVEADKIGAKLMGDDWKDMRGYNASSFVRMADTIFPSRFKDYYIRIYLADHFHLTRADVEADEGKRWMLMEAEQAIAWRQVISEQSSLTRYKPQGFTEMRNTLDAKSSEISGLSIKEIRELRKKGKRIQDVVELSRADLDDVRSLREFELVGSVYEPLSTTERARLQEKVSLYYDETKRLRKDAMEEQLGDDLRFQNGLLLGSEWREAYKARWSGVNDAAKALQNSAQFKDAPFSKKARAAFNERFNISSPLRSPVDDVIDKYYEMTPAEDPYTKEVDWNGFFKAREDVLKALPSDIRPKVEEYLHRHETPVMREFREGRKYMAKYWDLQEWLPFYLRSIGHAGRADNYAKWSIEYRQARRESDLALQQGVDPDIIKRRMARPEFRAVQRWESDYRAILRNSNTVGRIPWADKRIPEHWRKFYSS